MLFYLGWALLKYRLLFLVSLAAPLLSTLAYTQMVSPDIDRKDQPFSYFSKPTDIIGVMNAPGATEISPEGYLYTGFGELMFFVGPEQQPISARIRTLEDGYLPIVTYTVTHLGIEYRFTAFSSQVPRTAASDAEATGQIVNFVRITMHNPGTMPGAAFLTTALRYQAEQTTQDALADNRFRRPVIAERPGEYQQPGEPFRSDWKYSIGGGSCMRDDRTMFVYPQQPAPRISLTLRTHYNRIETVSNPKPDLTPLTPVCSASYALGLAPGESKSIDLRMPLAPTKEGSLENAQLMSADFDRSHAEVVRFWQSIVSRGMRIELPESKPVQTFYASLVYDLLARNIVDGRFIQTASQFQYHRFYLRDSADYVRMYDATGYKDVGSQVISFFETRQQQDGNFMSQPGQYDGWGEALWCFGEHYRRTHDTAAAEQIYPRIVRAVDWLIEARANDPLHVMPASDVRDNEYVSGHLTGYNFLALDGLRSAIELAQALGHKEDAVRFEKEYASYSETFFALLAKASAEQGGIIPPSLDAGSWKGTDWGNLLSVTPEALLNPFDPRVTATLKSTQARYQEGITTYAEPDDGVFLHHYLTIKNTLTELVRGEQEQAMREFYAELLHTSSTQAGFEYAIRPWGSRDFEGNIAPHGWFAADYRNLLRNMMVREQDGSLHLLSAVSPEWIAKGKRIRVSNAPTYFGNIAFELEMQTDDAALIHIRSDFDHAPTDLVLHLPWFLEVTAVSADGKPVIMNAGTVHLPSSTREVSFTWKHRSPASMSFDRTVTSYEAEYRRRYEHLVSTGQMSPLSDPWQVPE
jgi:hypothetical protein